MERLIRFFTDNFPDARTLLIGAPAALAWSFACLSLAAWLKRRGWRTGYTRKVFHFLTFATVAAIGVMPGWGTTAICLFGGMTSLVILYAILRGERHPLYEAVAREKDAPHRTWYIIGPYFATLIGGVTAFVLFEQFAVVGVLVTGVADAAAEPVGTRFGRHRYPVWTATKTRCQRSLEGSAAVFIASIVCVVIAAAISPAIPFDHRLLWIAPATALACTAIEAVTPHGWDNLTLQIAPTWIVWMWIG